MVIRKKRMGFTVVDIFFDDRYLSEINPKKYGRVTALSYSKFNLPNHRCREKDTALIPLLPSEDEIFGRFNKTTRNEISRTQREEEYSVKVGEEVFNDAYNLYKEFEYGRKSVPFSKEYVSKMKPLVVYDSNEPIAGLFLIEAEPYMRIFAIFSKRLSVSIEKRKRVSFASRRSIWEACQLGKSGGFESLDLSSVNRERPETRSIADFKMSFGGEICKEYTYTYRSPLFRAFEYIAKVRVWFLAKLHSLV